MLGEPDDAGVVLRCAAVVPEPELLQAEHARTQLPGEPVEGRRTEPPTPDDDHFVVFIHARTVEVSPESVQYVFLRR